MKTLILFCKWIAIILPTMKYWYKLLLLINLLFILLILLSLIDLNYWSNHNLRSLKHSY